MSVSVGSRLGPYELLSPLGRGGMGEVYRARDVRLDRLVALKILPASVRADPSLLRRFRTEARAAAALSHPNVVAVYDLGEAGGVSYIVTELVEGQTLASMLQGKPFSLPELLALAVPIAEALACAHLGGIVHRDLKPSNILVSEKGQPKIADFGLAKDYRATPSDAISSRSPTHGDDRTREGTILGTAPYMSPEQVRGGPVDARSDQFSFGVMLYEMATGRRPFDRDTAVQTLAAILDEEPPWQEDAMRFPVPMVGIVRRCLEKDPQKRYAATEDLAHDLRALLEPGKIPRQRPKMQRLLWFGVPALLLILVGALALWRALPAAQESTSLAVLPFRDLGREAALSHFGLGMADAIISRLSTVQAVTVRPTSAIARYEGQEVDAGEIGRRLRVRHVLEGTFQKIPEAMRVTAQLTDVSRGALVWSKQVDVPDGELFKIQDATSMHIVEALRLRITPEERERLSSAAKVSDEAVKEYSNIRAAVIDVNRASQAMRLAQLQRLTELLEREPGFARALGTRAYVASLLNFFEPSSRWHDLALADAKRALALNDDLVEPIVARAHVLYSSTGGWRTFEALQEFKRAAEKGPGDEIARLNLARLYRHVGWMDEAEDEIEATERINPETPEILRLRGLLLLERGRCGEAADMFRRGRSTEGEAVPFWQSEAMARLRCGEVEIPLLHLERQFALSSAAAPERALTAALLAIARLRAGQSGVHELEQEALSVDQRVGHFHHVLFALAELKALSGEEEAAVAYLRRSAETGMPCPICIETNPLLANLRTTASLRSLVAELRALK